MNHLPFLQAVAGDLTDFLSKKIRAQEQQPG
jgi:hypothetical protein